MSDEEKFVEVKSDQGTESLGNSAYFAARDGQYDRRGFRSALIAMLGLIACVFLAMMLSSKRSRDGGTGKPIPSPSMTRGDPVISSKLLTARDLTNVIRRPKLDSSILGKIKVVSLRSISEIPIGSEMNAILESGATDGIVKAKLQAPLLVDGEPILPQGAVLFGKGKSGDERLLVEFSKVIFPTGEAFSIRAQAFDSSDKILGLKGAIVGSRTKKMAGAMAFGFLGGMADGLQDTSGSSLFYGKKPSVRDGALAGASKAALDQSQMYLEELKRSPNVVEVKAGTSIVVITDEPKSKEDNYESK